jgi:hypothetical protein
MALINDYEIHLLEQVGLCMYGLDAAEHNGWGVLALTDTSRVDAGVSFGPLAHHLRMVLGYKLHDMRDDHNLHFAVFSDRSTAYLGQYEALAGSGGENDQRVGVVPAILKPLEYRINRLLLVGT